MRLAASRTLGAQPAAARLGRRARRGAPGTGVWKANAAVREAERKMAEQAEAAYRRSVAEFKRVEALRAKQRKEAEKDEEGAGATSGCAS